MKNENLKSRWFSRETVVWYVIIFILPFLMFFWMIPFVSDRTLGNDYPRFSIDHQMELMFSVETGSFPLYVPGFAGGQTASALTQAQIFHPISHLALLMPGYWNGKALEWITLLRLLLLGGAHIALFIFLRKLRLGSLMAFVLTTVTVYNLRMLDLFRYGASLEAWTGHLFLCAAIGSYCLKSSKWQGPLFIIGATYYLICSGHPQMMYYGLLGAGLFALVIPYFLPVILPDRHVSARTALRFWLRLGFCLGIAILLSSAYILPFYADFIASNAGRVGRDYYTWADLYQDTFAGTLNNFFYPLRSDVHGAYGGSSLFLVAALIPILHLFRVKIPGAVWAVFGLTLMVFLHIQGSRTLIHYFAWKYLPFASSFRCPGRISLIMPILIMLILIWIMRAESFSVKVSWPVTREIQVTPRAILALTALIMMAGYVCIPDSFTWDVARFSATSVRKIPHGIEQAVLLAGATALTALAIHGFLCRKRFAAELLLCVATCAQILCLLYYGTWTEIRKDTPSFTRMLSEKHEKLKYQADLPGFGLCSAVVIQQAERSCLEPFLGKVYRKYLIAENNEEAYSMLEQGRAPDQVIVEQYVPDSAILHPSPFTLNPALPDKADLIYSSFNRLDFEVNASVPGFFGLAYPYTGHWKAFVNGHGVHVYRANGSSHAVRIPAGVSLIEFRYQSRAALWGMILSFATLALISSVVCLCNLKKPTVLPATAMILILCAGGFALWHRSLYAGTSLDTIYSWKSDPQEHLPNLAYNKRTRMSSNFYGAKYPYLFSSGQAVDGDRRSESGSVTPMQNNPWWTVDLYRPEMISSVTVYESRHGPGLNLRPLKVMLSDDGKVWRPGGVMSDSKNGLPLCLMLKEPQKARYVMIKASGLCRLAIDEVEIF